MSSVDGHDTPSSLRKERAAIAAQACQTCRQRKSKCDEQRPKCGLCRRLGAECEYREPLPTKKDKTMVHILDALTRLESKFDNLSMSGTRRSLAEPSPDVRPSISGASSSQASGKHNATSEAERGLHDIPDAPRSYQHLTVPHKIMLWPGIYLHLLHSGISAASDLQYVLQEGTPWFIRREMMKHPESLPARIGLPCFAVNTKPPDGGQDQAYAPNVAFPTLSIQQIQEYSDAYFNTFNILSPLLNRDTFMNGIVAKLIREGYGDGDPGSVLALLVFALGQVALEGVFTRPITVSNHGPSGFRGGSAEEPPGLAIFNEARRRIGFIATQCNLENVQIMLLQATYFEAHARHLDFWRCTVAASMACQVLIRCNNIEWSSPRGDLIKRAYWVCVLSEDLYHLDLDLPQTGIQTLEDEVPLPYFQLIPASAGSGPSSAYAQGPSTSDDRSHFQYHFLAMIALRRLITRIHSVIHESSSNQAESADEYGGPPVAVVQEMARQLDSWRALLPRPLQWEDSDRFEFPSPDPTTRRPNEPLFSVDQGSIPIGHKYNFDIATAQLRTRFYYARYIMYRPFVYKALHFPEMMTPEDKSCCALAIKSACMWPMCMAPPKNKKRLVPHLFTWTQNFMGILLILRMTVENACLREVCDEYVNREEVEQAAGLMLDWVRDVKHLDGIAEWSWQILEPLYSDPSNEIEET